MQHITFTEHWFNPRRFTLYLSRIGRALDERVHQCSVDVLGGWPSLEVGRFSFSHASVTERSLHNGNSKTIELEVYRPTRGKNYTYY